MSSILEESFNLSDSPVGDFQPGFYSANPIPYESNLKQSLDTELLTLKKLHFLAVHSLDYGTSGEARERFIEFRDAFRSYVTNISGKLYVHLRHALSDDPVNSSFFEKFEVETRSMVTEFTEFLVSYSKPGAVFDSQFKSMFIEMGARFVRRSKQERSHLFSLYKPTF